MKKSLFVAAIAAISLVACKKTEAETTAVTADSTAVAPADSTATPAADSTAVVPAADSTAAPKADATAPAAEAPKAEEVKK